MFQASTENLHPLLPFTHRIILYTLFLVSITDILSKYNESTDIVDVKMQHALLSTLKNLVIPKENKAQVLEEGLIDVIYPMIKIDQYLVVFKLLGTFRMVIDGQGKKWKERLKYTNIYYTFCVFRSYSSRAYF